ncbi:MAG: hypothetical protein IJW44_03820 [Clostridia bacterium]|nr:hypothetical protein [Clostridia bacterium]
MNPREQEEFRGLYARLEDLALRAEQGELAVTDFLSPREAHFAARYLARRGVGQYAYGGYEDAERTRLYLLPEYMLYGREDTHEPFPASEWASFLARFGYETGIAALQIHGSGYRALTHRDYLGSLLGLGIERSVLGDILVPEEGACAVVLCDATIAGFIESEMTKAANDKVRVRRLTEDGFEAPPRQFLPIHDTVASGRLDCVIAALCGLSRERARETVCAGLVEINFESEDRPDRVVTAPALLSVRGFGRYRVLALTDRTRKGRIRLEAERYV